jgi:hypothetical protein
MIQQAARRPDEYVDAHTEGVLLRTHADAAEDRGRSQRRVDRQCGQIFRDLCRQFARRCQHEGARRAAWAPHQLVQDGQQERRRLAAPGHRTGQQVAALERGRDRFRLNRCGSGEAEILETAEEVGMKLEVAKRQTVL